ncbi:Type IV prepilin peptidase TadV/CpaA [Candidatus Rhodobacter oscarellae]|uniref:Type IV prepilin peptidase TadV/CpaA n=1 Tax=Candidatus Rhodobacter oscarellae TaxID=1675527 RepID=A0A0J9ECR1_9RHOB|nr:prepilin peptidase [Candidatus Rhodobacter lobularis]KMW59514.1 Type IV prepilin peptidase TadV/CpaA [Candidatus Rhodobacter lobularis]
MEANQSNEAVPVLEITSTAALWLLPVVLPICLWVMYTDLKDMKIRNKAVLALLATYAVIGFIALPLDAYLWGYAHFAVILVIGFLLNMTGALGAGDVKFAAAMALFVSFADTGVFMMLLALAIIAAFMLHRIARLMPFIRAATPNWVSWDAKKFPMGTALGSSLAIYLALGAAYGA